MGLKVEFVRYRNILCATILEQGDEIERGAFGFYYGGYGLSSYYAPELEKDILCIRGIDEGVDQNAVCYEYDTADEAIDALKGFKAAIEAYNASLLEEQQKPTDTALSMQQLQTPDIETVVVG